MESEHIKQEGTAIWENLLRREHSGTHRMLSEGGTAGLPRSESEAHEGEREESYAQEMRRGSDNYLPAFLPSLSSLPLPLMNNQSCDKRFPK